MTKSDLILLVAARFPDLPRKKVEASAQIILDGISDALVRGIRTDIQGFGSFFRGYRPPRIGRNPKTGVQVLVPRKFTPRFKARNALEAALCESANFPVSIRMQSNSDEKRNVQPSPSLSLYQTLQKIRRPK